MTEVEWWACTDPGVLLESVREQVSDRKLRLFACACCRTVWHLLHKRARRAVRATEEWLDGLLTSEEWERARAGMMSNTYWVAHLSGLSGSAQRASSAAADAVWEAVTPD